MKKIVSLIVIVMMALSITACGSGNGSDSDTLNIFVWTEDVPQSVIDSFTKETGIKVNVSTFSTNEDMLAKVKSESDGTYDIIQPSDYMVEQLIGQKMLEELDKDTLTNLDNIGDAYLNLDYDKGNKYSVPYQGGVAAIAVNTSKIKDTITSYADLFNSSYKNSIVSLDDYRAVIGMAAKSIGYGMNETDANTLNEIKDRLLSIKDNIKLYDSDSPKSALISGDCTLAYCWNGEIALAMQENKDIQIVFPSEGAFKFLDNWCVPKGAKHYDDAMKFINYMLDKDSAKVVMNEYPYLNPNTAAVDEMDDDYKNNEAKNIPSDIFEKGEFVQNLSNDVISKYDEMWTELKQ